MTSSPPLSDELNVSKLYDSRFEGNLEARNRLWAVLCREFFQQFIPNASEATVLDIGSGFGEFINNIKASRRIAVDLNDDSRHYLKSDVEFMKVPSFDCATISQNTVDIVFMSNLLEHMYTKAKVLETLKETHRILKSDGLIMILGPNIKYAYREYWDFFDHHIPLSHDSLQEALNLIGFKTIRVIPRFLPYTTKSNLPQWAILVKLYLRMPISWKFFGKQMFILAQKP